MKRCLSIVLAAALVVSLAGCGNGTATVKEGAASGSGLAAASTGEADGSGAASAASAAPESPEPEAAVTTARMGDTDFAFSKEEAYYDVSYRYPEEFELEVNEETGHPRHLLRYHAEGYDPEALKIVITRTEGFTPEERLKDLYFSDVTTEEIGGVQWAIGVFNRDEEDSNEQIITYSCAKDDYAYTFSFLTDYPGDFDATEFARAFAGEVTIQ